MCTCIATGSTSETASSRPVTADAKVEEDDGYREVSAASSRMLRGLPEYSIVPSAADMQHGLMNEHHARVRTASVEYFVEDEDEPPGAGSGSGVHEIRRPHTSATPGGRGGGGIDRAALTFLADWMGGGGGGSTCLM